jgi:hypothetical protein
VPALLSTPVSDVFSGGVAFSYFPTSDGYGMITLSADGTRCVSNLVCGAVLMKYSVATSDDFKRLSTQYNASTGPNSPAQSSQSTANITCPGPSASFLGSNLLPPTPNEAVCNCVNENAYACRVTQRTANEPAIVGGLTE